MKGKLEQLLTSGLRPEGRPDPALKGRTLELMVTCRRHGQIQEEALVQKAAGRRDKKTAGYRDFHCPSLGFVVFKH